MSSLFGIGGGGNVGASGSFYDYSIDQSLRFNDDDSAYLSWTPASAGNRKTWTWSCWVKRSSIDSTNAYILFDASTSDTAAALIEFGKSTEGDNSLNVVSYQGSHNIRLRTSMRFRDVSSWYHIVVAMDTSQATDSDRVNIYVNGTLQTDFQIETYPAQNHEPYFNSTNQHHISKWHDNRRFFDGYLAEVNFIDGTALDATSFGETINGVWVPKQYSGSYGTNGFYLSFADSSAIGDDLSGNTNDWTANSINAHDVVPDSPTNNFATMNPLDQEQQGSNENLYASGNLNVKSQGSTGYGKTRATFAIPTSGKWYWEMRCTNTGGQAVGILNASEDLDNTSHFDGFAEGYSYKNDGTVKNNGTGVAYGDSWTNGDNIGFLVDADAGEIFFYKNGTIQNSGTAAFTGLDMTNDYMPIWADRTTSSNSRSQFNFGQDSTFNGSLTAGGNSDANGYGDFQYTVPTNALALCSANLPEPAIGPNSTTTSDEHFNIALYQSNGGLNTITGLGHQPDFLWIKQRDSTNSHAFTDSVRGPTKALSSNLTDTEYTYTNGLQSFDTDGFTLNGNNGWYNSTTLRNYVAWSWKAGGTAVSNTDGSITSSVSANTDAGFSIVSYTGTGANATVGHGLASAPEMLIIKTRDSADNWPVYHAYNTSQPETDRLLLSTTDATVDSATMFNDTLPTSSVFSVGTNVSTNKSGDNFICYAFHSVEGHLKCGSYVGNGSADGTFVYTGFRPAWIMVKATNLASQIWLVMDNKRDPDNVVRNDLNPNDSTVESSNDRVDFLSNGFKWRNTYQNQNNSGTSYIYLAFAEAPFKYANAR